MLITVLKSKLHHVTVTEADINYVGSCAIDVELLEAAEIQENEQIHIYNVNNGERFTTYAIASAIPGIISVRGSATRKVVVGDTLIITAFGQITKGEIYRPNIVFVNSKNLIT
jgi:aspartate 1-decarboxylase